MGNDPLAGLVFEAWNDMDRVLDGLDPEGAALQPDEQSSMAWTLGHVTEHVDRMINADLQGRPRHPLLGTDRFRMGSAGAAEDWEQILAAVQEVRDEARPYLEGLAGKDLDESFDFSGAVGRQLGSLTVRYVLTRIAAHHYFHIGVVACQRDRMGHEVGDYPGLLAAVLTK